MSTAPIEYARDRPPPGYRRRHAWLFVLIGVALLQAAYRGVVDFIDGRADARVVGAWHAQARDFIVPAGTLLYSERAADFRPRGWRSASRSDGPRRDFATFTGPFVTLRTPEERLARTGPADPMIQPLYVHEHLLDTDVRWLVPHVVAVDYGGVDFAGRPRFDWSALRMRGWVMKSAAVIGDGRAEADEPPGRSLAGLRIYAGVPSPTDRTRFTLPFESDGGRGRFEFRTVDGPRLLNVRVEWDDAATRPATGATDAR